MKNQLINPYLPGNEYVPDCEPHVFGDRLYIFGSHDKSHGHLYCPLDYVCWSAPVEDLSDWTCSGVIYRKEQDPHYKPLRYLYAPDVVQGNDGRYYLYYALASVPCISVAVCDRTDGQYEYYGDVALRQDSKEYMPFDPGVFRDEDGSIWLYFGSCFEKDIEKLGAMCVKLQDDMLSLAAEPIPIVPNVAHEKGTSFEGHAFFEASSMRKFNGRYYFIYSSILSHELCYAVSDYPDRGFRFAGILHSNADIGLNGRTNEEAVNYWANNHGSIEKIGDRYYVFGHRHTQKSQFSRQGIAEEIQMDPDGMFLQAELTSQGLYGRPLPTDEKYPAYMASHLTGPEGAHLRRFLPGLSKTEPRVNQKGESEVYISNFSGGSTAGFKYFAMTGKERYLYVTVRGSFHGKLCASFMEPGKRRPAKDKDPSEQLAAEVKREHRWTPLIITLPCGELEGTKALYLEAEGTGLMEMKELWFE